MDATLPATRADMGLAAAGGHDSASIRIMLAASNPNESGSVIAFDTFRISYRSLFGPHPGNRPSPAENRASHPRRPAFRSLAGDPFGTGSVGLEAFRRQPARPRIPADLPGCRR